MCVTKNVTYIYDDGTKLIKPHHHLCEDARFGRPCAKRTEVDGGERLVKVQPSHPSPPQSLASEPLPETHAEEPPSPTTASTGVLRGISRKGSSKARRAFVRPVVEKKLPILSFGKSKKNERDSKTESIIIQRVPTRRLSAKSSPPLPPEAPEPPPAVPRVSFSNDVTYRFAHPPGSPQRVEARANSFGRADVVGSNESKSRSSEQRPRSGTIDSSKTYRSSTVTAQRDEEASRPAGTKASVPDGFKLQQPPKLRHVGKFSSEERHDSREPGQQPRESLRRSNTVAGSSQAPKIHQSSRSGDATTSVPRDPIKSSEYSSNLKPSRQQSPEKRRARDSGVQLDAQSANAVPVSPTETFFEEDSQSDSPQNTEQQTRSSSSAQDSSKQTGRTSTTRRRPWRDECAVTEDEDSDNELQAREKARAAARERQREENRIRDEEEQRRRSAEYEEIIRETAARLEEAQAQLQAYRARDVEAAKQQRQKLRESAQAQFLAEEQRRREAEEVARRVAHMQQQIVELQTRKDNVERQLQQHMEQDARRHQVEQQMHHQMPTGYRLATDPAMAHRHRREPEQDPERQRKMRSMFDPSTLQGGTNAQYVPEINQPDLVDGRFRVKPSNRRWSWDKRNGYYT